MTILAGLFFVLLYGEGFAGGDLGRSLRFGAYFGLGGGVSMGLGMHAVIPIPAMLAGAWLLATVVEALAGAVLLYWVYGRFGAKA